MAITYSESAVGPYLARRRVAMNGEVPPARTAASCAPSEAPLYRTRVPNSSEKNAACGPYIAACEKTKATTIASQTSGGDDVSSSRNNGQSHNAMGSTPTGHT